VDICVLHGAMSNFFLNEAQETVWPKKCKITTNIITEIALETVTLRARAELADNANTNAVAGSFRKDKAIPNS